MATAKITEREVATLRTASKRTGKTIYLWDTELKGFGLRISASGRGSWLLRKWVGGRRGKEKRLIVGHLPMTVDEARTKVRSGGLSTIEQSQSSTAHRAAPPHSCAP